MHSIKTRPDRRSFMAARRIPIHRAAMAALPILMALALPVRAGLDILPWKAEPGKGFDLMITGTEATCATEYSYQSVDLRSDTLVLSFLAKSDPAVKCQPLPAPKGPEFAIPALKAGSYLVFSRSLAPCMVGPTVCAMEAVPVFAGSLEVAEGNAYPAGWMLRTRRIPGSEPSTLTILNRENGSCETGFSNNTVEMTRDGAIHLTFQTIYYKRMCRESVHPFGPIFHLEELKPGRYPVYAASLPACSFDSLPCEPFIAPQLVDTLLVGPVTGIRAAPGSAQPAGKTAPAGLRTRGATPTFGRKGNPWVVTPEGRRVAPAPAK